MSILLKKVEIKKNKYLTRELLELREGINGIRVMLDRRQKDKKELKVIEEKNLSLENSVIDVKIELKKLMKEV